MHKRTAGLVLSGVLATGAAGAVVMTPASAATSDNVVTSRLANIKNALSGLVSDGTLTKAQADKVASTLDSKLPKRGPGGPGSHGGHFGWMGMTEIRDAAAKALGMTTDKLNAALQSGKSMADVAKDQKVSVDVLVKAMVDAAKDKIAAAVKAGTITQAQADKMTTSLTKRITNRVNDVRPDHGRGQGHRHGPGPGPGHSSPQMSPSMDDTSESVPSTPSNVA